MSRVLSSLAVGLLAAALAACGLDADDTYDVTGVVEGVYVEDRQIKIAHDDIPGFMPAMTMSFDVANPGLLAGVTVGNKVRFKLERTATTLRILELSVTGIVDPGSAGVSGGKVPPIPEKAPVFELTDQDGKPRDLESLLGRAVLVDFIFTTCPGPCPMLTASHVALQKALPAEIRERTHFVSITLDPERDTPEALRSYAEQRGADLSSWSFLTGDAENVKRVLQEFYVGSVRRPDGTIDHLVATYLIDPQGQIVERYIGLEVPRAEIIDDLRRLLS